VKKKRFSEEQIISILKEHEVGITIKELARKYEFCEQTFLSMKEIQLQASSDSDVQGRYAINHKKVYRLCCEENLRVRK